ncbi:hypothetical protein IFO69_06680 [Echinicola sp. CAU 1574]|uniref:ABC transporter ATPase n=1 Tax=Echinicola arenosa TaxID=2774144 RepID=A0ABR9AI04_9BACT|nr:hypothetical protein [Echinicola arenosa]MBD8488428.1 hypothetical protein [Echinicola arenosa]
MYLPFEEMPDSARVWVYQGNRKFNKEEIDLISSRLTAFCNQWNTHGNLMPTSFDIKYDQFIILSVDESQLGASGCSIDSSVQTLRELDQVLQANLLDQGKVSFVHQDEVTISSLGEIKEYIQSGALTSTTKVFNPVIQKKEDLNSKWIIPAGESWLNRYFNN